jgi:hypothetical protein
MVITREEAYDMEDAHSQGLHDELPREGCPTCSRREPSSYPTAAEVASKQPRPRQHGIKVTYSSAAPYIREALMRAASRKLSQRTQREQARASGEMQGLVSALKILLASNDGKDSEVGYPDYHGVNEGRVLAEIERFVGGAHEMIELGFKAT